MLVEDRRFAVDDALDDLVSAIRFGAPVDETHLQNLRGAIGHLEDVVEHELSELVPDATPFERTVGRVTRGRMADALDVEIDELNRALELVENGDASAVAGSDGESAE